MCGYGMVLLLFTFTFKNKLKLKVNNKFNKNFFESSNIAYLITGFITLIASILCYIIISSAGIPKKEPEIKVKSIPLKISYSINYYLPGWA